MLDEIEDDGESDEKVTPTIGRAVMRATPSAWAAAAVEEEGMEGEEEEEEEEEEALRKSASSSS